MSPISTKLSFLYSFIYSVLHIKDQILLPMQDTVTACISSLHISSFTMTISYMERNLCVAFAYT